MDSLSFRIPEQQAPTNESFDTRPAAVQQWLEQLPLGHIGESARRLYEMLREVNRLDIPLTERFALLEGVRGPLHTVLDALQRHYTGLPFPLPQKALRVARFSTGLLQETVIAYLTVLNDEKKASWFFRLSHPRLWLETVHRITRLLNQILCNYRLIHRAVPGGVWLAMHQLYWAAREGRRHQETVRAFPGERSSSIEAEYKRALLLSMVEPQLLNREQQAEIYANMALWTGCCELRRAEERPDGIVAYCIRRDADAPHTTLTEDCCKECGGTQAVGLLLDMEGLGGYLATLLRQMGDGDTVQPVGGSTISRDTVEALQGFWRNFNVGRSARTRSDSTVEVAIGMSAIFQLLQGGGDATARGISDQHMSDTLEEWRVKEQQEQRRGKPSTPSPGRDVWDTIFSATEIVQKSWVPEAGEREYSFIPARQRDYNEGGYCLEFATDMMGPLQVGELVGVRSAAAGALQLCMVRWLSEGEGRLTAGLMLLADTMEPALVVVHQERHRSALHSLMVIGRDHRPQLFLPHLPAIRSRRLGLVVDNRELPLTLHDRVVVSPLFDAFHFQAATVDTAGEMTLEQVNRQLHGLTHPQGVRAGDDFSDLWASL